MEAEARLGPWRLPAIVLRDPNSGSFVGSKPVVPERDLRLSMFWHDAGLRPPTDKKEALINLHEQES
jgi:hypothetical protein